MSDVSTAKIGRAFTRVGWTGVCLQGVLMILPLFMLGYMVFGKVGGVRASLDFTEYLAIFGLLVLAFTTFWSFYYTRIGRQIQDPARRPTRDSIVKILWIGLWTSCFGIVVSLLTLFIEVIRLLIVFMKAPQGGVPVIRTEFESRTQWVSAIDAVSLLAEVCTLAGEFLLLGLTLWLLFRITRSNGYVDAIEPPPGMETRGTQDLENTGAST